jgi:uncharacterized protein YndB with AHSA1/START domain
MAEGFGTVEATHREVGRRTIAAGEVPTALMRRHYNASVEDVWEACTDPSRINRWFIEPKGDLREGGRFSLEGNASGDIVKCEPPRLLTLTWEYGEEKPGQVELRLSPDDDGGTILELEHATAAENAFEALVSVGVGWEPAFEFLGKYLRGDLPDTPIPEGAEFTPPPELLELLNQSGLAWGAVVGAALQNGQ